MLVDGEKFACASCIKGHRVSNCNHSDRPLTRIAPKGRPVKQCDHCRDARKSKSHHAKCDCGNKRTKDKAKNDMKSDDIGCCCHKGETCVCGVKSEALELRLETVHARPALPVKSKPRLSSSTSEAHLSVFAHGHKVHKHNNLAHTSGQPYKVPHRPKSLHAPDSYYQPRKSYSSSRSNSMDNVNMLTALSTGELMTQMVANNSQPAHGLTLHTDNLNRDNSLGFFSASMGSSSNTSTEDLSNTNFANFNWLNTNLASVTETPLDYSTSPSYQEFPTYDWNLPTAEANDYFSPADLPLMTNVTFPEYAQPISHSGESGFHSVPTLTASSSGARSENGAQNEADAVIQWNDQPQLQEADVAGVMEFSYGLGAKTQPVLEDLQSFSNRLARAHRLSDSTAVPDNMTLDTAVNTDLNHYDEFAVFGGSAPVMGDANVFANNIVTTEAELGSITIPAGVDDDTGDWYYPTHPNVAANGRIQPYGWVLETQ